MSDLLAVIAVLQKVPPADLLGVKLLQQHPPSPHGTFFPTGVPTEQIVEATVELIAYTQRSRAAAHNLSTLFPIPLKTLPIWEFGL